MVDIIKEVFTTGEAAKIMKVSQQTVIRCFDSGQLKGFRVPGSRFRRIPREVLYKFMKDNGIPTDAFEQNRQKVMLWGTRFGKLEAELAAKNIDVQVADGDSLQLGLAVDQFRPQVLVIVDGIFEPNELSKFSSSLQSEELGFTTRIAVLRKNRSQRNTAQESNGESNGVGLLAEIRRGAEAAQEIVKLLEQC
jgi:excisionase family DNA binding protein